MSRLIRTLTTLPQENDHHARGVFIMTVGVLAMGPDALVVKLASRDAGPAHPDGLEPLQLVPWRYGLLAAMLLLWILTQYTALPAWRRRKCCRCAGSKEARQTSVLVGGSGPARAAAADDSRAAGDDAAVPLAVMWQASWRTAVFGGILTAMLNWTIIVAFLEASGANALFLLATNPFWTALVSLWVLGEPVARVTWLAIVVATAGISLVFVGAVSVDAGASSDNALGVPYLGEIAALLSAVLMGCSITAFRYFALRAKRQPGYVHGSFSPAPAIVVSGLINVCVAYAFGGSPHSLQIELAGAVWIGIMGFVQLPIAFLCYFTAPQYLSGPEVALMAVGESVVGPVFVALVLDEVVPALTWVAGAIVITTLILHGLYQARVERRRKAATFATASARAGIELLDAESGRTQRKRSAGSTKGTVAPASSDLSQDTGLVADNRALSGSSPVPAASESTVADHEPTGDQTGSAEASTATIRGSWRPRQGRGAPLVSSGTTSVALAVVGAVAMSMVSAAPAHCREMPRDSSARELAQHGPDLVEPANGTVTVLSHPHFAWSDACVPTALITANDPTGEAQAGSYVANPCSYTVEVSTDTAFTETTVIRRDSLPATIARWVPVDSLPVGVPLWWRVSVSGDEPSRAGPRASEPWLVTVAEPAKAITVPSTATFEEVASAVSAAVSTASGPSGSPTLLQFARSANYTLAPPTTPPGVWPVFLNLSGATDLVVDCGGSTFVFSQFLTYIECFRCLRVEVRNVFLDFDPLPYTAMSVTTTNPTARTFAASPLPGHPSMDAFPLMASYGIGGVMDAELRRVKRGSSEVVPFTWHHANATNAAADTVGYVFNVTHLDQAGLLGVDVGDVFFVDPRVAPGFLIDASDTVVLSRVVAYAVSNEAFTSAYTSRLSILRCGIVLLPGRYLAANNGGHNHHSSRVSLWVEGGVWENAGDDTIHVSSLAMEIAEASTLAGGATSLQLRPCGDDPVAHRNGGELDIDVGDTLAFFDHHSGAVLSRRTVTSVAPPCGASSTTAVVLDGPVGPVVPGSIVTAGGINASVTQVYDLSRTQGQMVWRNNLARNGRRVGLLAKGARSLVERNIFDGLGGGGLETWNAPVEGLGMRGAVIRNNVFNDTNQLNRVAAPMWAAAMPAPNSPPSPGQAPSYTIHGDILVSNNTIAAGPGPSIMFGGVADVLFTRNTIIRCAQDSTPALSQVAPALNVTWAASNIITRRNADWLCIKTPQ